MTILPRVQGSAEDAPVAGFAQCHVGILQHLDLVGELPALARSAARGRQIAADILAFFDDVVLEHHAREERELFTAVLEGATVGEERDRVEAIAAKLTAEHRQIEQGWKLLKPALKQLASGTSTEVDESLVARLMSDYAAHAAFEEQVFLPLSETILGRNPNHMAALGLALHMRHMKPVVGFV